MGYAEASMDQIALEANISKATLYRYYPTKETLFAAALTELPVARFTPPGELGADPQITLEVLGRTILDALLDPMYQDLLRVALAERSRFPELAAGLWDRVVGRGVRLMTGFFERGISEGRLRELNPGLAAQEFVGMLLAHGLLHGLSEVPTTEDRDQVVRQAVGVFLYGAMNRGAQP
jgi:TetR/AcrR family transcriptional repressor of mexJK operon